MSIMSTWGPIQSSRTLAEGIVEISTASHGGIVITEDRWKELPAELQAINPWAGKLAYEEDQDWAVIALAWPDLFSPKACAAALRTAQWATTNGAAWGNFDLPAFLASDHGKRVIERAESA